MINTPSTRDVDRASLEVILSQAETTAPLISSLVQSVGFSSGFSSRSATAAQLLLIKLVAILVILCKTVHKNNSNYFPLLVALYLYSAGARVDTVTLFNYLGLSVLYNILFKKLREISLSSITCVR